MEEYTPEALVNREEPIPVLNIRPRRDSSRSSPDSLHSRMSSQSKNSLQDRLFTKLLQQVIPAEEGEDDADASGDKVMAASIQRPAFSLPLMANNFRRFNARIGVVFLFQSRVERLLSWRRPTQTLSFLAVYSFICLDPHLMLVLPLAILLLFIMVPAFVTRHPPPPATSTSSTTPYYSYEGPALAPARTIRPASETSKDFLRNMRDLQNTMADFSDAHDAIISVVAPLTNFSNEKLSSTVFLVCTVLSALLFLTAHLLPLRPILLVGGNAAILSSHPTVRQFFIDLMHDVSAGPTDSDWDSDSTVTKKDANSDVFGASLPADPSAAMSAMGRLVDISLDTDPEEREVEIFELQHRAPDTSETGWENFLFSPLPYDPLSPSRIAGDRPRGCRFFEDVQPPFGWMWKSKKWELDLDCREWVVERMITGVGFEIPGVTADGNAIIDEIGGWVWDLPPSPPAREEHEEMPTLGYGDLQPEPKPSSRGKDSSLSKDKGNGKVPRRDWEEAAPASYGVGEWRRRRWVRVVQRISLPIRLPTEESVTYSSLGR